MIYMIYYNNIILWNFILFWFDFAWLLFNY